MGSYRVYADGRVVFEDDFDEDNQDLDLGGGDDYEEYRIPEEIFDYIVDCYSQTRASTEGLPNCPCCNGVAEWESDEYGIMIRCTVCGINTGGELGEANIFTEKNRSLEENHLKIWRGVHSDICPPNCSHKGLDDPEYKKFLHECLD